MQDEAIEIERAQSGHHPEYRREVQKLVEQNRQGDRGDEQTDHHARTLAQADARDMAV